MIAQAIIWALVLALFGTNGGSAKIRRVVPVVKTIRRFASAHQHPTTDVTMKTDYHGIAEWGFSFWFALLSPVIGILLGMLGVFLLYH